MSLIGYRWWYAGVRPAEGWRLRSVIREVWWDGPHLTASAPPEPGNGCGIHAFKTWSLAVPAAKELDEFPCEGSYPVLGAVALWGKVVEHERGFRAEHAIVRQLWVPQRILLTVRRPEERYGCLFFCLLEVDEDESTIQVPAGAGGEAGARAGLWSRCRTGPHAGSPDRGVKKAQEWCCLAPSPPTPGRSLAPTQ